MKRGGDKEKILPPTLFLELLTRKCCNFLRCKSRAEFQRQLISCLEQFERLRVHGCIRRQTHIGHLHSHGTLVLKEFLIFICFVNPSCFYISLLTLYNTILRIASNFLETRENIKILTHPFYHINLG